MATKIKGQITIIDLNDARSIYAQLSLDNVTTLIYDTTSNSYVPNFEDTPLNITPAVYVTGGSGEELISAGNVKNGQWKINGVLVGENSIGEILSNDVLRINENLTDKASYFLEYIAEYVDPITSYITKLNLYLTLSKINSGSSAVTLNIIAPKGVSFGKSTDTTLTLMPVMYKGSTKIILSNIDTQNATKVVWYKSVPDMDSDTDGNEDGWFKIGISSLDSVYVDVDGNLIVSNSAVDSFETFKCSVKYDDVEYQLYIVINDNSDLYLLDVYSPTGTTIVKGADTTKICAKVLYNGTEIDPSAFTFTWAIYDKDGTRINWDSSYEDKDLNQPKERHGINTNGGSEGKYNYIIVNATDIERRCTFICEAVKNNE